MSSTIAIILFSITTANIMIHSIGCYLLVTIHKNGRPTVQSLSIINLSASELLASIIVSTHGMLRFLPVADDSLITVNEVSYYFSLVLISGVCFNFYMAMYYIAADRFLGIWLNITYPVYCDVSKAKKIIIATWLVSVIFSISLCVTYKLTGVRFELYISLYFLTALDFVFLLLAFTTYGFIFYTCSRKSRVRSHQGSRDGSVTVEEGTTAPRFKLYCTCIILILSFLLLIVVPHLCFVFFVWMRRSRQEMEVLVTVSMICYALSDTVNAFTYVFLQKKVRFLLLKKIRIVPNSTADGVQSDRYVTSSI